MRKISTAGWLGCVAATALIFTPAAQAMAQDGPTQLTFTRDAADQPLRTVTLSCDPDIGSHPDIDAACRYLEATADLTLPEESPEVRCIRYNPVSLRATGTLHGRPITEQRTYSCVVPDLPPPWQF
ncbi:SSI family serine proteinase inhibitor [Nocardia sp. alder85J]|uniref:SSI family serine proteinase inhibitor n=1 Tax=Nocardia sp. alder85J TaxID=2862949 RepID=UPI001CD2051F|nr:SSI family serine proteinase inhibitor [Nocardia sp. alder85J]MCX4092002.1 SSI family serine proteinase inhibitor [Nocardia sp. alder85J]